MGLFYIDSLYYTLQRVRLPSKPKLELLLKSKDSVVASSRKRWWESCEAASWKWRWARFWRWGWSDSAVTSYRGRKCSCCTAFTCQRSENGLQVQYCKLASSVPQCMSLNQWLILLPNSWLLQRVSEQWTHPYLNTPLLHGWLILLFLIIVGCKWTRLSQ